MRKISITDKLVLYFIFLGIVSILIIGIYSFYTSKKALMDRTFEQLNSIRADKKKRIESFFMERTREIQLISKSEDLEKFLELSKLNISDSIKFEESNLQSEFNRYLIKYLSSSGYYNSFLILDNKGNIIEFKLNTLDSSFNVSFSSIQNHHLNPLWNKIRERGEIIVSDYLVTGFDKKTRLYIGCPIKPTNEIISGMVCLEISVDQINSIMLENIPEQGFGISGESYLVGSDYLIRSKSRFQDSSILNTIVKTDAVKKAFNNEIGTVVTNDYRGIKVLSSFNRLDVKGLDWIILSEIDFKEATKSIYNIRINLIFLTVVILLILFGYTYIISKRIVGPIVKLKDASIKVGEGDLSTKVEIKSNDEIGELSETFNKMTSQLRKQSEELEMERSKRISSVIDGQEMERQRLSRELHDSLGQKMVALKLQLANAEGQDFDKTKNIIGNVQKSLDSTIDEIRRISNDLMPSVLNEFGLKTAVKKLCSDIEEHSGITIKIETKDIPDKLDKRIKTYIFRIIQEALSNSIKHSSAKNISVRVKKISNVIHLTIKDNGKGFDVLNQQRNTGHGIQNIRERVTLLKGKFEIYSHQDEGTSIIVEIPLNNNIG